VEDNRHVLHSPSLGVREGRLEAVIDINLLREQPEAIRASQIARGADVSLVDQAVQLDLDKRSALAEFERLRAAQNQHGKLVASAPKT
jgi:seryl-tRNA synthetase